MTDLDFPLFDADNHYYEPRDAFTRYIEPQYRDKAIRAITDPDGSERLVIGDKPFTFLESLNFDVTVRPGSLREMLRSMKTGRIAESSSAAQDVQPEYVDRDARLALMDREGLESVLMFPTIGVCVEHFMTDDADQMYANVAAFNRWLLDDWGYGGDGRIYGAPIVSLLDRDRACDELETVLDRGARIISMRPGPAYGRSPADPHFDPFWARLDEAGVAVAFHIGESGYNQMYSVHWGEKPNPSSHRQSAFQWMNCYGDRPIMETLSALIVHNLFGRYPNIRVVSVENGSLFVPYLLASMDKMVGMGRNGPWIGGRLSDRPSEVFKEHVYVSPYHEEPIADLVDLIGAQRVLFGSDYPHSEGLAHPGDFADPIRHLPEPELRSIMHDNAARVVGR